MKKIIASAWHPGSANSIIPVVKMLKKEKLVDVIVIAYEFSEKIFSEGGIDYRTINSYNLKDISITSMEKILEIEKPDMVLIGTSFQDKKNKDVIEQTLTLAAREKNIKTLAVVDGWCAHLLVFNDLYNHKKLKFIPDKIAVIDKLAEKEMLDYGCKKNSLVITGNPYFDEISSLKEKYTEKDKRKTRKNLGIGYEQYVILYASQPIEFNYGNSLGYTEKTVLTEITDALKTLYLKKNIKKNITLIIKLHPREKKDSYRHTNKKNKFQVIIIQDYPIRELILTSDIVLGSFSTVLIEAAYLNKASISVQPGLKNTKEDLLITNKLGLTVSVHKKGQLSNLLERMISDNHYIERFAKKGKPFRTDSKATEKVVNLIYNMLSIQ